MARATFASLSMPARCSGRPRRAALRSGADSECGANSVVGPDYDGVAARSIRRPRFAQLLGQMRPPARNAQTPPKWLADEYAVSGRRPQPRDEAG
jgi:hypothetical protein